MFGLNIRAAELAKERSDLEPLINKTAEYRQTIESLEEAKTLLDSGDPEMVELAEMEIAELEPRLPVLEREIKALLLPKDPRDERSVIMETGGQLVPESLPPILTRPAGNGNGTSLRLPEDGLDLEKTLADFERRFIHQALERCGHNKTKAANLLGLSFRSFRYRLEKLDL